MSSKRAKIVIAASVAAAVVTGVLGCRLAKGWTAANAGPGQQGAAVALAQGAGAIAGVQSHTRSAEAAVQQAVPHADSVGQAHLATASGEHSAVLAEGSKLVQALDALHQELRVADERTAAVQEQLRQKQKELEHQQEVQRELEGQWYVRGGRWIERMFWTLAIGYLVVSVASGLLGLGNPLGWMARLRNLAGSTPRWIGEAFAK